MAATSQQAFMASQMSVQQEDTIIHTRITNDEKALRRVTKKFHNYASVAYNPVVPPSVATSVDDARDAFLVELASFHLSLKKSLMVCEAEARQVEEYQRERERITNEHTRLRDEIESLKTELEQAQIQRRRKQEYDGIAEKVNTLPSRDELEQSIRSLENDMAAIRAEHEDQTRTVQAQKTRLDMIISDIAELRTMGKQDIAELSQEISPSTQDVAGIDSADVEMSDVRTREESGELKEEKEEGALKEKGEDEDGTPAPKASAHLNPVARSFLPHVTDSRTSTPLLHSTSLSTPAPPTPLLSTKEEGEDDDDDIEMGELAEDPIDTKNKKRNKEDLEEGEASDLSSELSDPPDD
ncbi:hypothetical protein NLI96_g3162 [Meripilus lineatus]|uniref:Uncharacterized protein n=1 Tax=Meripilus lineatus TaxID=2056292 RepID=A0AAD5V6Y9_9APHY|nr:hypothetical protein NLI96_g3162 [Physisporinus lineatus]